MSRRRSSRGFLSSKANDSESASSSREGSPARPVPKPKSRPATPVAAAAASSAPADKPHKPRRHSLSHIDLAAVEASDVAATVRAAQAQGGKQTKATAEALNELLLKKIEQITADQKAKDEKEAEANAKSPKEKHKSPKAKRRQRSASSSPVSASPKVRHQSKKRRHSPSPSPIAAPTTPVYGEFDALKFAQTLSQKDLDDLREFEKLTAEMTAHEDEIITIQRQRKAKKDAAIQAAMKKNPKMTANAIIAVAVAHDAGAAMQLFYSHSAQGAQQASAHLLNNLYEEQPVEHHSAACNKIRTAIEVINEKRLKYVKKSPAMIEGMKNAPRMLRNIDLMLAQRHPSKKKMDKHTLTKAEEAEMAECMFFKIKGRGFTKYAKMLHRLKCEDPENAHAAGYTAMLALNEYLTNKEPCTTVNSPDGEEEGHADADAEDLDDADSDRSSDNEESSDTDDVGRKTITLKVAQKYDALGKDITDFVIKTEKGYILKHYGGEYSKKACLAVLKEKMFEARKPASSSSSSSAAAAAVNDDIMSPKSRRQGYASDGDFVAPDDEDNESENSELATPPKKKKPLIKPTKATRRKGQIGMGTLKPSDLKKKCIDALLPIDEIESDTDSSSDSDFDDDDESPKPAAAAAKSSKGGTALKFKGPPLHKIRAAAKSAATLAASAARALTDAEVRAEAYAPRMKKKFKTMRTLRIQPHYPHPSWMERVYEVEDTRLGIQHSEPGTALLAPYRYVRAFDQHVPYVGTRAFGARLTVADLLARQFQYCEQVIPDDLPDLLPPDKPTFTVHMTGTTPVGGVSRRGVDGCHRKMEPYLNDHKCSAQQWRDVFHRWLSSCAVSAKHWAGLLTQLQGNMTFASQLHRLRIKPTENYHEHYFRVLDAFLDAYTPTPIERAAAEKRFYEISRGPSEDIKVYLERFQEAFSATYPNEEIHSEKAFGVLFRSLSPDFQREHSNLKFAPYDIDEDDERVRREYRGNVIVSSTPQFHGIIRAFYKRRNPRDVQDEIIHAAAVYRAKQSAMRKLHATTHFMEQEPTTSYAEQRAADGRHHDPYSTPAPSATTRQMYEAYHSTAKTKRKADRFVRAMGQHAVEESSSSSDGGEEHTHGAAAPSAPNSPPQKKHRGPEREETKTKSSGAQPSHIKSTTHPSRARQVPNGRPTRPVDMSKLCQDCCIHGHTWSECFRNPDAAGFRQHLQSKQGTPQPSSTPAMQQLVIAKYGKIGAPPGKQKVNVIKKEDQLPVATTNLVRLNKHGCDDIIVIGTVGNIPHCTIFVDTGSQVSLVSMAWYRDHKDQLGALGPLPDYNLHVASGATAKLRGTLKMNVTFRDKARHCTYTRATTFSVMEGLSEPILAGLNMLKEFFLAIDLATSLLSFRVDLVPDTDTYNEDDFSSFTDKMYNVNAVYLSPRSIHTILVRYDNYRTLAHHSQNSALPIIRLAERVYDRQDNLLDFDFPSYLKEGGTSDIQTIVIVNKSDELMTLQPGTHIGTATILPTTARLGRFAIDDEPTAAAAAPPSSSSSPTAAPAVADAPAGHPMTRRSHLTTVQYHVNLLRFNTEFPRPTADVVATSHDLPTLVSSFQGRRTTRSQFVRATKVFAGTVTSPLGANRAPAVRA